MNTLRTGALLFTLAALPGLAAADDRGSRRPASEFKHEYQDGNCKVERKREKNGDTEEKIDCKGGWYGRDGRRHARSEFREEFRDGPCKVKRELQKDGDYKEERKCRGREMAAAPAAVLVVPQPMMVQPAPVVVEPGVVIQGTIRLK